MIKKIRQSPKLFFLLVLIPSVIIPTAGYFLTFFSCPHMSGLAYFPIVSAECPGEFLGDIGLFCFGFPGISILFGIGWLLKDVLNNFPQSPLEVDCIVGLLINFAVYYLVFRLFLPKMQAEVKTSLLPKTPPEQDSFTDHVS